MCLAPRWKCGWSTRKIRNGKTVVWSNMKLINLTQGKQAIVDEEAYHDLSKFKWMFISGYAARNMRFGDKRKTQYMHRVINKTPNNMETDHVNGNTLDNRIENLRTCTHKQNMWNSKMQRNNTSGFKGVSFHKKTKKWQATLGVNGGLVYLGLFGKQREAALAYNYAVKKYFKDFAKLNNFRPKK